MSVADSQVLVFKCWSLIQFRAPVFGPQKSGLGPSATWVCGCCCQALPYLLIPLPLTGSSGWEALWPLQTGSHVSRGGEATLSRISVALSRYPTV